MVFSRASQVPIFKQLQLEEALFRTSSENHCLAVYGSAPSIVMGAFGNLDELVDLEKWNNSSVPIIRRYSGGGTVVVDEATLFLCFILQKKSLNIEPYPKPLMQWVFEQIRPLFKPYELLWVDNDFCLEVNGKLYKVAGNAQSISQDRMVHHLCLPWSYSPSLMNLLKLPSKRPQYRQDRSHEDFLYPLSQTSLCPQLFIEKLQKQMQEHLNLESKAYFSLETHLQTPHRKATLIEKEASLLLIPTHRVQ